MNQGNMKRILYMTLLCFCSQCLLLIWECDAGRAVTRGVAAYWKKRIEPMNSLMILLMIFLPAPSTTALKYLKPYRTPPYIYTGLKNIGVWAPSGGFQVLSMLSLFHQ